MLRISLFKEDDVRIDIPSIADNLNRVCENLTFVQGKSNLKIKDDTVYFPDSYASLGKQLKSEVEKDLFALLVTDKPYYNNYFFEHSGPTVILSMFDWQFLTPLSRNNGLVFFIANLLALDIDNSFRHDDKTNQEKAECIYDFGWDKTGVDIGMRSALICPKCLKRIENKSLSKNKRKILSDLQLILNDLGNASKWGGDIIDYWERESGTGLHKEQRIRNQIFISYSHMDKNWLDRLKVHLKPFERESILDVWSDEKIKSGSLWRKEIQRALDRAKVAVLLVTRDFLASDFIAKDELPPLLDAADNEGATIIPVLVKPSAFQHIEDLAKFQAANDPSRTLIEMDEGECDRFLVNLIGTIIDKIRPKTND